MRRGPFACSTARLLAKCPIGVVRSWDLGSISRSSVAHLADKTGKAAVHIRSSAVESLSIGTRLQR